MNNKKLTPTSAQRAAYHALCLLRRVTLIRALRGEPTLWLLVSDINQTLNYAERNFDFHPPRTVVG